MAKAKKTTLRKPQLSGEEAISFAELRPRGRSNPASSRFPPADYRRLTVNFPKELHHRLKVFAAQKQTTIGQMMVEWTLKNLPKE